MANFEIGHSVLDLTFDPPAKGKIIERDDKRPNAFRVQLDLSGEVLTISARNLRNAEAA